MKQVAWKFYVSYQLCYWLVINYSTFVSVGNKQIARPGVDLIIFIAITLPRRTPQENFDLIVAASLINLFQNI